MSSFQILALIGYLVSIPVTYSSAINTSNKIEDKLKENYFMDRKNHNYKKYVETIIPSLIPFVNIIYSAVYHLNMDEFYELEKQLSCKELLKDNKRLCDEYDELCSLCDNTNKNNFEKKVSTSEALIEEGFNKKEVIEKIFKPLDEDFEPVLDGHWYVESYLKDQPKKRTLKK